MGSSSESIQENRAARKNLLAAAKKRKMIALDSPKISSSSSSSSSSKLFKVDEFNSQGTICSSFKSSNFLSSQHQILGSQKLTGMSKLSLEGSQLQKNIVSSDEEENRVADNYKENLQPDKPKTSKISALFQRKKSQMEIAKREKLQLQSQKKEEEKTKQAEKTSGRGASKKEPLTKKQDPKNHNQTKILIPISTDDKKLIKSAMKDWKNNKFNFKIFEDKAPKKKILFESYQQVQKFFEAKGQKEEFYRFLKDLS